MLSHERRLASAAPLNSCAMPIIHKLLEHVKDDESLEKAMGLKMSKRKPPKAWFCFPGDILFLALSFLGLFWDFFFFGFL